MLLTPATLYPGYVSLNRRIPKYKIAEIVKKHSVLYIDDVRVVGDTDNVPDANDIKDPIWCVSIYRVDDGLLGEEFYCFDVKDSWATWFTYLRNSPYWVSYANNAKLYVVPRRFLIPFMERPAY